MNPHRQWVPDLGSSAHREVLIEDGFLVASVTEAQVEGFICVSGACLGHTSVRCESLEEGKRWVEKHRDENSWGRDDVREGQATFGKQTPVSLNLPEEVAQRGMEQTRSIMQLLAAFVLTDEEVKEVTSDGYDGWAESMRNEVLGDYWRPIIVAKIRQMTILTNTHPGYPIGDISRPDPGQLLQGLRACEKIATRIRTGEVTFGEDDAMIQLLQEEGCSAETARGVFDSHGKMAFILAKMDRKETA